jgi:hypothetical protein
MDLYGYLILVLPVVALIVLHYFYIMLTNFYNYICESIWPPPPTELYTSPTDDQVASPEPAGIIGQQKQLSLSNDLLQLKKEVHKWTTDIQNVIKLALVNLKNMMERQKN